MHTTDFLAISLHQRSLGHVSHLHGVVLGRLDSGHLRDLGRRLVWQRASEALRVQKSLIVVLAGHPLNQLLHRLLIAESRQPARDNRRRVVQTEAIATGDKLVVSYFEAILAAHLAVDKRSELSDWASEGKELECLLRLHVVHDRIHLI